MSVRCAKAVIRGKAIPCTAGPCCDNLRMMPRLSSALVALAFWLWLASAAAQVGIAYVEAPEQSSATCTAGNQDLVFKQHRDGFHGHRFTCGLESRKMALKVAALQCDRAGQPQLHECAATEFFDPDGRPQKP